MKWLNYAAAASSIMAMSASVDTAVIYSGLQNISMPGGNANNIAADINGDTVNDFSFYLFSTNASGGYTCAAVNGGPNNNGVAFNDAGLFAENPDFGDIVGGGGQIFVGNGNQNMML